MYAGGYEPGRAIRFFGTVLSGSASTVTSTSAIKVICTFHADLRFFSLLWMDRLNNFFDGTVQNRIRHENLRCDTLLFYMLSLSTDISEKL
jgi:hypothetical protein